MILRLGWGEEENVDQREVMAARSASGKASRDYVDVGTRRRKGVVFSSARLVERHGRGRETLDQGLWRGTYVLQHPIDPLIRHTLMPDAQRPTTLPSCTLLTLQVLDDGATRTGRDCRSGRTD